MNADKNTYTLSPPERQYVDKLMTDAIALQERAIGALELLKATHGLTGDGWNYNKATGMMNRPSSSTSLVDIKKESA